LFGICGENISFTEEKTMTKYQFDMPDDFKEYLLLYKAIHKKDNMNDALIEIVREKIDSDEQIKNIRKKK
jgi:hypothetical protein